MRICPKSPFLLSARPQFIGFAAEEVISVSAASFLKLSPAIPRSSRIAAPMQANECSRLSRRRYLQSPPCQSLRCQFEDGSTSLASAAIITATRRGSVERTVHTNQVRERGRSVVRAAETVQHRPRTSGGYREDRTATLTVFGLAIATAAVLRRSVENAVHIRQVCVGEGAIGSAFEHVQHFLFAGDADAEDRSAPAFTMRIAAVRDGIGPRRRAV